MDFDPTRSTLVDTHTHIYDEAFANDYSEMLDRATRSGVGRMIVASEDVATSKRVVDIVSKDDRLYAAVGIHPSEADRVRRSDWKDLEDLLKRADELKIVAVGEIGLDYYWTKENKRAQKDVFRRQLELACKYDLPVIIHDREAHEDCLKMVARLKEEGKLRERFPGVFHCYSGSAEFAQRLIPYDFYFGFDGPLTFKNAKKTVEAAASIPKDRLLLETDCPYLAPVPYRGKRNEPAFVSKVMLKLAEIWGWTPEQTVAQTTLNAKRLFSRMK